jgi:hypothetical protein
LAAFRFDLARTRCNRQDRVFTPLGNLKSARKTNPPADRSCSADERS